MERRQQMISRETKVAYAAAVIAIACSFLDPVFPKAAEHLRQVSMPLFVLATFLLVRDIRTSNEDLFLHVTEVFANVRDRLGPTAIRKFESATAFHDYVRARFSEASRVKVTHFTVRENDPDDHVFHDILQDFLQTKDKKYWRVVADTDAAEVWTRQQEDLAEFNQTQLFIHVLPTVAMDRQKLVDIMIIDEEEVCFGGGYQAGFQYPVLSIRNAEVVGFFMKYYDYLLITSPRLTEKSRKGLEDELRRVRVWTRIHYPRR